jgi:hypothetical protein
MAHESGGDFTGNEVMAQRNSFRNSFAADKWCDFTIRRSADAHVDARYPWLEGETFDSVFVPVTFAQGAPAIFEVFLCLQYLKCFFACNI